MSQNDLIIFGVVMLIVLLASPAVMSVFKSAQRSDRMLTRLESQKQKYEDGAIRETRKRTRSLGEMAVNLGKRAAPGNEQQLSAIRFKLLRAGFLNPKSVAVYFAVRLVIEIRSHGLVPL